MRNLKFEIDVRWLQILNFLVSVCVLLLHPSLYGVAVSLFMYAILLIFGVNIGYHRALTHGSLKQNTFAYKICVSIKTLVGLGKPID
jgi:fatty-acid desaturase